MYNVFNTQSGIVYIVDMNLKNCSCTFQDQFLKVTKRPIYDNSECNDQFFGMLPYQAFAERGALTSKNEQQNLP